MKKLRIAVYAAALMLVPLASQAVQPNEILSDPVLEERARDLSKGLRCLVCRNESIDESNAELAQDLRLLVRERLVAGDSNDEVMDFVVDRYGEFVLLKPQTTGSNLFLWLAGPAMLLVGAAIGASFIRRQRGQSETAADGLSDDEKSRLDEILKE